jgi:hypothetical protein
MIKTRVNNPERVFLNSSDDGRNTTDLGFSQFTCTYDTPILGAKKTMMLRATIPNAQINIPDYQLVFWYYSLPTATTVPTSTHVRAVRLYPSWYQPPTGFTAYTKNRYFSDPADFVTQLNLAAGAGGDNATYNSYWVSGDVSFSYNASTKQISFTGNTAGRFYAPIGWNDPEINAIVAANPSSKVIALPSTANIAVTYPQLLVQGFTLNLRVGYAMSGTSFGPQVLQVNQLPEYADLTHVAYANGTAVVVDSFPNLVYSQCVYLYSNIIAGSSLGSGNQHNLLAVVPSNAPQLGVIQYTALTVNHLSKLSDTIYEITIEMRDDANQPFTLPDNAQVNIEMAFLYTD